MRRFVLTSILLVSAAAAQTPAPHSTPAPTQSWRSNLSSLPAAPLPNTTPQDIAQFEKNMRMAATYLGNTTPNADAAQWEANRALVRRMATYLYGLQALSGKNQLRGPISRAQHSFDTLGLATFLTYLNSANAPNGDFPPGGPPPPEQQPRTMLPPFALDAPESTDVSDADKATSADLHTRYETDAAHSAGVWQNAETLRQTLESRGMGLNLQTATSMVRLPVHFNAAANALRRNDWDGALTHLQQAEAETEKIEKTVGR